MVWPSSVSKWATVSSAAGRGRRTGGRRGWAARRCRRRRHIRPGARGRRSRRLPRPRGGVWHGHAQFHAGHRGRYRLARAVGAGEGCRRKRWPRPAGPAAIRAPAGAGPGRNTGSTCPRRSPPAAIAAATIAGLLSCRLPGHGCGFSGTPGGGGAARRERLRAVLRDGLDRRGRNRPRRTGQPWRRAEEEPRVRTRVRQPAAHPQDSHGRPKPSATASGSRLGPTSNHIWLLPAGGDRQGVLRVFQVDHSRDELPPIAISRSSCVTSTGMAKRTSWPAGA